MATLAGSETNVQDLLIGLIRLGLDIAWAHEAALTRLCSDHLRKGLSQFLREHRLQIEELAGLLRAQGREPPAEADLRDVLVRAEVIRELPAEDLPLLREACENECDAATALGRAVQHRDLPRPVCQALLRMLANEGRHHVWLEEHIRAMKTGSPSVIPLPPLVPEDELPRT